MLLNYQLYQDPPPALVQPFRRRHRRLYRQAAHILPPLLQQRNEIIDGQHDVPDQLILRHAHIAYRHAQTEHLLQLELDCGFDFGGFGVEIFRVGYRGGEFAGYMGWVRSWL